MYLLVVDCTRRRLLRMTLLVLSVVPNSLWRSYSWLVSFHLSKQHRIEINDHWHISVAHQHKFLQTVHLQFILNTFRVPEGFHSTACLTKLTSFFLEGQYSQSFSITFFLIEILTQLSFTRSHSCWFFIILGHLWLNIFISNIHWSAGVANMRYTSSSLQLDLSLSSFLSGLSWLNFVLFPPWRYKNIRV